MTIIAGLLCFVIGTGIWWFLNSTTLNDSMVEGVAYGGMVVMFAFGVLFMVSAMFGGRKFR